MAKTGRPPKDKRLLMNIPLRIMLTAEQRDLIEEAAKNVGADMTAWARPILIREAKRSVTKASEERNGS